MALRPQGPARGLATAGLPALIAAAFVLAPPAAAQITALQETPEVIEVEEPFPFVVLGLTGTGSFNTYSMTRLNRALETVNMEITQPGVRYADFGKGASGGAGIRAIFKERLVLETSWERVFASRTVGGTTSNAEISVPADAYMVTLGWDLMKKRRVGFGVAAGAGWYDANGEQVVRETPVDREEITVGTIQLTGSAVGMHAGAFFESILSGHVWVNAFVGYRKAHLDDLEISGFEDFVEAMEGQRLPQTRAIAKPVVACAVCPDEEDNGIGNGLPDSFPEGAEFTLQGGGNSLDWSGFMGRLALTWYFNVPVD